ncbi:MAG: c-type cytochrome [bacterium]|jgi:sulfide dehydrogenase cytochrome subunit
MKLLKKHLLSALILGSGMLVATAAQAEDKRGMVLALSCASCHGTNGNSPGSIPAIAGKSANYIESAMKQFRDGARYATVMNRIAKGYTDEEIKLLAGYLGNSKK